MNRGQHKVKLADIELDSDYMVRIATDQDTVETYADAMAEGADFPPLELFDTGDGKLVLVDGWHRYYAAQQNGFVDYPAVIHKGTRSEALAFALSANKAHGLRYTPADKRRAIELALAQWPGMSNNSIAEYIGCSGMTVSKVREERATGSQSGNLKTVTGKDGKQYPAKRPTVRDVCAEAEREAADKDDAEAADTDNTDDREREQDERDEWRDFEDAAATAREAVAAMESLSIAGKYRGLAAKICKGIAHGLMVIAVRLEVE